MAPAQVQIQVQVQLQASGGSQPQSGASGVWSEWE